MNQRAMFHNGFPRTLGCSKGISALFVVERGGPIFQINNLPPESRCFTLMGLNGAELAWWGKYQHQLQTNYKKIAKRYFIKSSLTSR